MKLPEIRPKSKERNSDLEDISKMKENYNPFKAALEKVIEIRIYLSSNFTKAKVSEKFMTALEDQYAKIFLEKMNFLPTKKNIERLIKMRPLENCDFHLSVEQLRTNNSKILHIFPNNRAPKKKKDKLQILLSDNQVFIEELQKNSDAFNKVVDNTLQKIKSREIKKDEQMLFQREGVDNMISKAKDDIIEKQLHAQTTGIKDKKLLSIENIRDKYLNPNNKNIIESNLDERTNAKAKFQNIDKAKKRDILSDDKYTFKFLDFPLNNNILEEVNKPMEIPVEIIMKDINFILDNFPIEELVDIEENDPNKFNKTREAGRKQLYYKIQSVTRKEIVFVYKKLQKENVFRIIGLTINLIYWIVFGFINRYQIDKSTKQYLYFKLLKEIQDLTKEFPKPKLYNKIYMPMLILLLRIECESIFTEKFEELFKEKGAKASALLKVNELITIIFDPHCYYNTFTITGGNTAILKHKLNRKILPKYKSKTFATSNLVDQLFTKFTSPQNILKHSEKGVNEKLGKDVNIEEWNKEKKFVAESKAAFFKFLFTKVNSNLKKRNLDPIFSVQKDEAKIKEMVKEEEENEDEKEDSKE